MARRCIRVYYLKCVISLLPMMHTQVNEIIGKYAKKGIPPSQIGVLLRDSYGVGQVKSVTGNKILRILKSQGAFVGVKM